jgi:signal recognition particle receptor subunit beta
MSQVVEFIVVGLPQTGKTTFIRTISTQVKSQTNQHGKWLYGLLPVDENLRIHFMEPPTRLEFDFIWTREVITECEPDGFIVALNASDTEGFGAAVYILQTIRACHPDIPVVVAANFQDVEGAFPAEDIHMGLQLPEDMPVLNCISNRASMVKEPVLELLYRVLGAAR